VLAHLIHGDVAGAEAVDDRDRVVAVEAKTTLLPARTGRKLACSIMDGGAI
jgi:hypothetical protein